MIGFKTLPNNAAQAKRHNRQKELVEGVQIRHDMNEIAFTDEKLFPAKFYN